MVRFPSGLLAAIDSELRKRNAGEPSWRRPNRSAFIQRIVAKALKVAAYNGRPLTAEEIKDAEQVPTEIVVLALYVAIVAACTADRWTAALHRMRCSMCARSWRSRS